MDPGGLRLGTTRTLLRLNAIKTSAKRKSRMTTGTPTNQAKARVLRGPRDSRTSDELAIAGVAAVLLASSAGETVLVCIEPLEMGYGIATQKLVVSTTFVTLTKFVLDRPMITRLGAEPAFGGS